jgi:hypothetical protein
VQLTSASRTTVASVAVDTSPGRRRAAVRGPRSAVRAKISGIDRACTKRDTPWPKSSRADRAPSHRTATALKKTNWPSWWCRCRRGCDRSVGRNGRSRSPDSRSAPRRRRAPDVSPRHPGLRNLHHRSPTRDGSLPAVNMLCHRRPWLVHVCLPKTLMKADSAATLPQ